MANNGALEQELVPDAAVELEPSLCDVDRDRHSTLTVACGWAMCGVSFEAAANAEPQRQRDQECQQERFQVEPDTQTATGVCEAKCA